MRAVADKGMAICGPNCFGIINVRSGAASFSGVAPKAMAAGHVALVSQSGSLGNFAFGPLVRDRKLGFSHFISCGNQIGTTVEDYVDALVDDPDVTVIACVIEALKKPDKLMRAARRAHAQKKSLVFFQVGTSATGQVMIRSHTGALAGNTEILRAFLRRCGIVQADSYDQFVETIELLANAPFDTTLGDEVVLVSGSGGSAAVAADCLDAAGMTLATLDAATSEKLRAILPEFAQPDQSDRRDRRRSTTTRRCCRRCSRRSSPQPGRPIIAATVNVAPVDRLRRIAGAIADAARTSGRTIVAYQSSPLGPLDDEIVRTLHAANVPLLLGIQNAMGALKQLKQRRDFALRCREHAVRRSRSLSPGADDPMPQDFVSARRALAAAGVPVVEAALASSAQDAVAIMRRARPAGRAQGGSAGPAAQERPRLREAQLHDRERGHRRLRGGRRQCARRRASRPTACWCSRWCRALPSASPGSSTIRSTARRSCFGLGGIFVELLRETVTEMAPLTTDDALRMIQRRQRRADAAPARAAGRAGDVAALADVPGQSQPLCRGQCRPLPRARSQSHHRQAERRGRRRGRYRDRARRTPTANEAQAMSYKDLIYGVDDQIATITLNRPERMNALSPNLEAELHRAFDEADADPRGKVIVLTGSRQRVLRRLRPEDRQPDGKRGGDPTGKSIAEFIELLASQGRRARRAVGAHVAARHADHRRGQWLGHGRRLLVSARRRHHDCVGQGGVRAAGGAPHLEYELPDDRAMRLEGGEPLGADRRPLRRAGGAAHRHGQRGGAARPADGAHAMRWRNGWRWCRSRRCG